MTPTSEYTTVGHVIHSYTLHESVSFQGIERRPAEFKRGLDNNPRDSKMQEQEDNVQVD
jgi:hypothetical protein